MKYWLFLRTSLLKASPVFALVFGFSYCCAPPPQCSLPTTWQWVPFSASCSDFDRRREEVFAKYHLDSSDPLLKSSNYPLSQCALKHSPSVSIHAGYRFRLANGRFVGYNVYNPLWRPRAVVLLFAGSPGGRILAHSGILRKLKDNGITLIACDRPGIGLSTADPHFDFLSHAKDVRELLDALIVIDTANDNNNGDSDSLKTAVRQSMEGPLSFAPEMDGSLSFAPKWTESQSNDGSLQKSAVPMRRMQVSGSGLHVLGYSAGGPHALGYASLNDSRVQSVAVLSCVGPPNTPGAVRQMPWFFAFAWTLITKAPAFVTQYIIKSDIESSLTFKLKRAANSDIFDEAVIRSVVGGFEAYGEPDASSVKRADILKYFAVCDFDAGIDVETADFALGSRHAANSEIRQVLLYGQKWPFDLAAIKGKLTFFQGTEDRGAVPAMARYMYSLTLGADSHLQVAEGKGHLWFFDDDFWQLYIESLGI